MYYFVVKWLKGANMGLPKSIRIDDEALEKEIQTYIEKNDIKFKRLVNLALKEFISKKHSFKLEPVTDEDYERLTKENIEKHKKTLDLLK